jgi:hypothetical protein
MYLLLCAMQAQTNQQYISQQQSFLPNPPSPNCIHSMMYSLLTLVIRFAVFVKTSAHLRWLGAW